MSMLAELRELLGAEHAEEVPAGSPYSHDAGRRRGVESRADAVVRPADAEQVAAVVAWCYEHDVPVVARGGGSGMMGGAVAREGGVLLSLERMRGVRELEPGLWRMFVEAGMSTHDVHRLARENGLMFAPDPGAPEQSQIGGNVATNAGGPHALKYGVTGAWVSGLEVVLAPGELVDIGGWAAKDVAGYDLRSLMVGSEGTLGVITAVRLRLLPAPESALPVVVFMRDRAAGCDAIASVLAAGVRASVLDFLDGETLAMMAAAYPDSVALASSEPAGLPAAAGFALVAETDGSRVEAQSAQDALVAALGEDAIAVHRPVRSEALWRWRDAINGVVTGARGGKVSEDVVFPLERLCEGLERFQSIATSHGLRSCAWGHGGEGNVHATVLVDPSSEAELDAAEAAGDELFATVVELGGSIAGEHGVGSLKRGRLEAQWGPRTVELHEQLKRLFDPKGLINPGAKLARYPARSPQTTSRKESPR
jgi:FAD/FMN-containing dehydrogenase